MRQVELPVQRTKMLKLVSQFVVIREIRHWPLRVARLSGDALSLNLLLKRPPGRPVLLVAFTFARSPAAAVAAAAKHVTAAAAAAACRDNIV